MTAEDETRAFAALQTAMGTLHHEATTVMAGLRAQGYVIGPMTRPEASEPHREPLLEGIYDTEGRIAEAERHGLIPPAERTEATGLREALEQAALYAKAGECSHAAEWIATAQRDLAARAAAGSDRYGWHADGDLCLGPECSNYDERTDAHSTDVHSSEWWGGFEEAGRRIRLAAAGSDREGLHVELLARAMHDTDPIHRNPGKDGDYALCPDRAEYREWAAALAAEYDRLATEAGDGD